MPHPVKRIILTNHAGGMAFKQPSIEITDTMTVAQALEAAGLEPNMRKRPAQNGNPGSVEHVLEPSVLISALVSDGQVVYVEAV